MPQVAQITCRKCGTTFSALRSRCPNCNAPVNASSARPSAKAEKESSAVSKGRGISFSRFRQAVGLFFVFAGMLGVIVLVSTTLYNEDTAAIRPTATPALLSNQVPSVEDAPTPSPTAIPKVESIKILYMNTKDLTPQEAWPTMRVGESINVNAVVYPMDILNPVIEWSCNDIDETSLMLHYNNDGTVTLTCISADMKNVRLTASCYGTSVTITIYLREAA